MELPKLRDLDDPKFNPFFEEALAYGTADDPYPRFAELRSQGPVVEGDFRVLLGLYPDITYPKDAPRFVTTTYEAATQVLTNPAVFSNKPYSYNLGVAFGRTISAMDPPDHPRYRRIFQKIFLPQNILSWGTDIVDPVVHELMDKFIATGKGDLVQQFTLHYPFGVIYKQLDLPPDQAKIFHKLAIAQTLVSADVVHSAEASAKLGEFFPALIEARRQKPGDDLVTLLSTTEVEGEYLPEDVLVSFLRQLINAGGDTTYRGTSILLTRLLQNPHLLEEIRNDRTLIANAIEEALRIDGPVIQQDRWALTDTEVAGVKIPAGSIVTVMAGAANRDPAMFPDPDTFDIRRANAKRHLGFSTGPHVCIGQHLARIEMTRALNAILDRLPNVRLDPDMPPPQVKGVWMRVPEHIHVRFDPQLN